MSEHNTQQKSGSPWVGIIAGIVLLLIGAIPLHDFKPPVPGLDLNFGMTVAMIGVLLILFPVIKTFYVQPLEDAIHERNSNLERTFTEAEELRARMDQMRNEYEQRLAATEAQAREQIQAQIKEAQQLRQTLMTEATAKADELVKQAEEQIRMERDKVLTQLRMEVVNLTLQATEKVIGENMDTEKNRRLVQDFINRVEVPS